MKLLRQRTINLVFEALIPPELRKPITSCSECRLALECSLDLADAYGLVAPDHDARVRAHIESMRQVPFEVVALYARGTIPLGEAIARLERACDLQHLIPGAGPHDRPSTAPPMA